MRGVTLFTVFLLFTLLGCKKGYVLVEKSESFSHEKERLSGKKIFYLQPSVTSYYIRKEVKSEFLASEKYKKDVGREMEKAGRRNGFDVLLLDESTLKAEYSNSAEELLQLRKCIFKITSLQESPLNSSGRRVSDAGYLQQRVFLATPRFPSEFSHLSKDFSPYFGLAGIFAVDADPTSSQTRNFIRESKSINIGTYYYFYHIVVNIESSEVIYREIKKIPFKYSNRYLSPVIFDSYALLKKNLK